MCKSRNYNWQTDYIIIVIVNQVKSSQSSQQIFERLPANYVSIKSSRHLVIYNSFLYSQVCKNDQLCHCEGGFDPKDGCASGVTDIFIWIITRTTCAQPPRADPQELAFFWVGTLELSNPPGWGRKKRANAPSSVITATFFIDRTVE